MKYAGFTYYLRLHGYFQTSDDQEIVIPDLEPLYEPEPVAFSFDTPAWYVVFMLLLIAFIFGLRKWYKGYRSKEYRRTAIKKLEGIQLTESTESTTLNTIQITLKQVAISTYGRPRVAALFGLDWLQFLEKTGRQTPFTKFDLLVASSSEKAIENKPPHIGALLDIAKKWIRTHA